MIRWPHLGLYGSFSNCEAGLVEAISKNFFILDVLTQGRILGIVENLPDDPLEGDAYIIETYSYGAENSIMVWDGDEWKEIIPEAGFLMFNDQLGQFFWFDGASWIAWPTNIADVTGPNSSLDNSIARFDGVTGKFIQDSGIIIDDDDTITGVVGIYAQTVISNEVKTNFLSGFFTEDSSSVGVDQTVSLPSLITKFTGALESIADIIDPPASSHSRLHIIMNGTGDTFVIKNNSEIRTGTGNDLKVKDGAAIWLSFDVQDDQWVVVGGAGGGGSGGSGGYAEYISNLGIATSVSSNALTIALKSSDGTSDPSATNAVQVGFRSTSNGGYDLVSITSALSMTVSSGSTLGHPNGEARYLYFYLINNAGTAELAVSSSLLKDNSIVSTTVEGGSGSADSSTTIYSTTARSSVPIRYIGRAKSNQATAGTWASNLTDIKAGSRSTLRLVSGILRNTAGTWSLLEASNHAPINISSVVTNTSNVRVNYAFTATNIVSFLVTPDETYAKAGIFCGASANLDHALIEFSRVSKEICGYIAYNGSSWTVTGGTGNLAVSSFTSGDLLLTHDSCDATDISVSATGRDGNYLVQLGGLNQTQSSVTFHSSIGGAKVTTPTTNMKFFFSRREHGSGVKQMKSADMGLSGSNLWIMALLEE